MRVLPMEVVAGLNSRWLAGRPCADAAAAVGCGPSSPSAAAWQQQSSAVASVCSQKPTTLPLHQAKWGFNGHLCVPSAALAFVYHKH